MLRGLWQMFKDFLYDAAGEQFRTQEEVDAEIEAELGEYGTVVDEGEVPGGYKQRRRGVFRSPADLIDYVDRTGLPPEYIVIEKLPLWEGDDTFYKVWIEDEE